MKTATSIRTRYGSELTPAQIKAFRTLTRLIEKDEDMCHSIGKYSNFAMAWKSYFKETTLDLTNYNE